MFEPIWSVEFPRNVWIGDIWGGEGHQEWGKYIEFDWEDRRVPNYNDQIFRWIEIRELWLCCIFFVYRCAQIHGIHARCLTSIITLSRWWLLYGQKQYHQWSSNKFKSDESSDEDYGETEETRSKQLMQKILFRILWRWSIGYIYYCQVVYWKRWRKSYSY